MSESETEGGVRTIEREKTRLKEPPLYQVMLLNDDYTPMDFVVAVLEGIFQKSPAEATRIMLQVHQNGSGICGRYPREIAEAKVASVLKLAKQDGYPLKCVMEQM